MTGLFHLRFNACISPGPGSAAGQETDERENGGGGAWRYAFHVADPILVPIALFPSLSRWGLGTRNVSRVKAPTAKRSEKGDGDERDPGIIIWLERQETHLVGQNAQC